MLLRYLIETQEETAVTKVNQYVEDQLLHRFVAEEDESDTSVRLEATLNKLSDTLNALIGVRSAA